MKEHMYSNSINTCLNAIEELPTGEIKYYLLLLVSSIKNRNTELTRQFLKEFLVFINELKYCHNTPLDSSIFSFDSLMCHYQNLISLAQIDTLDTQIKHGMIHVGSAVSAFLVGMAGGLIGGVVGIARGIWTFSNPFKSVSIGVITGCALGAMIGFRTPKKLFKDELIRQIQFCLNGINECLNNIQQLIIEPLIVYEANVKERLLRDYFNNDVKAFHAFCAREDITFEINTLKARFISPTLEGYLGHHAFIKIPINEQSKPFLIEFSMGPSDLERPVVQLERRTVTGKKVIEMLALHAQLQVTHVCTKEYILKKMKPGDNDCLSYVNKVLIGSNQKATVVKRLDGTENWVGRHIIGFFVQKLSPFSQDVLIKDTPELQIS